MKISSSAFKRGGRIPKKYTGEGEDRSPPLLIEELPKGTHCIALIMDDPDAPAGTFDHWLAWNIPAEMKRLAEGVELTHQGTNHFGETSYRGPMPPKGHGIHHYFFKAYALDDDIDLEEGASKEDLLEAMESHILDEAEYMGTYERM